MPTKTVKKIGFWTAVAMLFGSVVGIGIFFKNNSISNAALGNGTATLLAWVIGGLISLFAAISFSEIGSQKLRNVFGLAAWSENALGKKIGFFTRFNLPFFYYGILIIIFGVFISEAFFSIIYDPLAGKALPPIWAHVLFGIGFDTFFIVINFISISKASWISRFATVIKIMPLVIAALAGVILATTNYTPGSANAFTNGKSFSFTGLLAALPAVLFAYDAFLGVGTISDKVKGGTKTTSKAIIVTLVAVLVLYSLIAISHILHSAPFVSSLIKAVLPKSAQDGLQIFVWVCIFISAAGVAEGLTAAGIGSIEQAVHTKTLFGSDLLTKKYGLKKATWISQAVISIFWAIVIFVPAIILKTDAIVDSFSNFPTLFFFAIYGLTILGYSRKRKQTSSQKINNKIYWVSACLAILGIGFVVVYQLVYGFTIRAFIDPNIVSGAGLFVGKTIKIIQEFGIFAAALFAFFAFPIASQYYAKRVEKHNPVVDTQALELGDKELI